MNCMVAVGGQVTPLPPPPHRSRRALLTHRAPVEGRTVIGHRGLGGPCSSDPWARSFGDMPIPALCPGHA